MGIFDRLGDVIRSYLNDEDNRLFGSAPRREPYGDPDLEAAFEELNDYLGGGSGQQPGKFSDPGASSAGDWGSSGNRRSGESFRDAGGGFRNTGGSFRDAGASARRDRVPASLRSDFEELGLPFGASSADCKAAYKKLLKLHHPDRHAGHAGNMKKATEKSARINAAYDRIEKWRETGETG